MYGTIYIIIAIIVAISAGVWMYRTCDYKNGIDYIPAIAAGFLWPMSILLFILDKFLDIFKNLCIRISDSIDEAEKKAHKLDSSK